MPVAVAAVGAVAAVDDDDGVEWRQWGGILWWLQHLTVTAMEYG